MAEQDVSSPTIENAEITEMALVSKMLQLKMSSDNIQVKIIDHKEDLYDLIEKIKSFKLFAFDCESVGLGRKHPISLMNISFKDKSIYLVDVQKLSVPDEFHSILSDPGIKKVMFDCRAVADCLKHQHQVILEGVADMQIMEYVMQNPDLAAGNKLPAFRDLVSKYMVVGGEKEKALRDLRSKDKAEWGIRPLNRSQLEYASIEISCFLKVKTELIKTWTLGEDKIMEWSKTYASSRRDDPSFDSENPYKSHRFMPLNILEISPSGNVSCIGCGTNLQVSAFSKNQLRQMVQKCKVCKAVKFEIDMEKNKIRSAEARYKQWEEEDDYWPEYFDKENYFSKMPSLVLIEIFKNLAPGELIASKQVSNRWYKLIDDNADILPKFHHCEHEEVAIVFEHLHSVERGEFGKFEWFPCLDSKYEGEYRPPIPLRKSVGKKLHFGTEKCYDLCRFDCTKCKGDNRQQPVKWSAFKESKKDGLYLKHYLFSIVRIHYPANIQVVIETLKTSSSVNVKELYIGVVASCEQIEEVASIFIQTLHRISFYFCNPAACLKTDFLKRATNLTELRFVHCSEEDYGVKRRLIKEKLFFDKVYFDSCFDSPTHIADYIKEFLCHNQGEERSCYVLFARKNFQADCGKNFVKDAHWMLQSWKNSLNISTEIETHVTVTDIKEKYLTCRKIEFVLGKRKVILDYIDYHHLQLAVRRQKTVMSFTLTLT